MLPKATLFSLTTIEDFDVYLYRVCLELRFLPSLPHTQCRNTAIGVPKIKIILNYTHAEMAAIFTASHKLS